MSGPDVGRGALTRGVLPAAAIAPLEGARPMALQGHGAPAFPDEKHLGGGLRGGSAASPLVPPLGRSGEPRTTQQILRPSSQPMATSASD